MTMLETLARRGNRAAFAIMDAFNPDQERDEGGRWTAGGASGAPGSDARASFHKAAATKHGELATKATASRESRYHRDAASAHLSAARLNTTFSGGNGNLAAATLASQKAESLSRLAHQESDHRRMVASGNDPRTTSSHEQDKMEARQVASGERVPLKQGLKQSGGYRGNPAAEGSRAVKEDDAQRMRGEMPAGWKPGVGYRPGLNDPKPALTDDKRDELTTVNFRGGGKGVTVTTAGALARQEKPSTLRTTQVEMPAVKEAPVALMAPHSQLPVGNAKPKEPIHDLKQTQKLPVVQERSTGLNQADVARKRLDEFKRSGAQADLAKAFGVSTEPKRLSGEPSRVSPKESRHNAATAYQSRERREAELRAIRDNPSRTPAQAIKAGLGFVKRSEMTKESRRDAAAASAGRWASRASEVKAKGQTQEDRQRISANLRAKGDPTKAAHFMQQSEQATALSKANALSALAAQHTARGDHAMAAKTYEEARAHYVRAGKDKVAAKMTWSKLEAEGKARKGGK